MRAIITAIVHKDVVLLQRGLKFTGLRRQNQRIPRALDNHGWRAVGRDSENWRGVAVKRAILLEGYVAKKVEQQRVGRDSQRSCQIDWSKRINDTGNGGRLISQQMRFITGMDSRKRTKENSQVPASGLSPGTEPPGV